MVSFSRQELPWEAERELDTGTVVWKRKAERGQVVGVPFSLISRKRALIFGSQPLARRPWPCSSQPHTPVSLEVRSRLEKTGKLTSNYLKLVSSIPSVPKTAVRTTLRPRSGGDGPSPSCLYCAALATTPAGIVRRDTWDSCAGDGFAKDESSFMVSYKSIARVLMRPDNTLCACFHSKGTFSSSSSC